MVYLGLGAWSLALGGNRISRSSRSHLHLPPFSAEEKDDLDYRKRRYGCRRGGDDGGGNDGGYGDGDEGRSGGGVSGYETVYLMI